jgi:hypothetical protein
MAVNTHSTEANRANESARKFKRYDQCRFAILVELEHGHRLLNGIAHYQRDDLLGNILRFSLETDSPGNPEIILAEEEWKGLITCGRRYHCDYCVTLSRTAPTSHPTKDASPGKTRKTERRRGGE